MSTTTVRSFPAHIEATAVGAPTFRSGAHDSLGDFLAVTRLNADIDSPIREFEIRACNEWLTAGLAGAIAYREDPSAPASAAPFRLSTYVEGDVSTYRFTRHEDAVRAGIYWALGLY